MMFREKRISEERVLVAGDISIRVRVQTWALTYATPPKAYF
jgi:hypothetical protein